MSYDMQLRLALFAALILIAVAGFAMDQDSYGAGS